MRSLTSARVLSWLIVAGILVLAATPTHSDPPAPQPSAKRDEPAPAVKKEDLRYDGKPFSYWQHYGRTELKAERRIEFLRAMAAFGTNGYAEEATTAILELVARYSESAWGEKVLEEASDAVIKIGPRTAPALLRNLASPSQRAFALALSYDNGGYPKGPLTAEQLPEAVVPTLVGLLQSKEPDVRSLALRVLSEGISARRDIKARLLAIIGGRATAAPFFAALAPALRYSEDCNAQYYAVQLLRLAGPAGKNLLPVAIEALNRETKRCKAEAAKPRTVSGTVSGGSLAGSPGIPGAPAGFDEKEEKPRVVVPLQAFAVPLIEWIGDLGPAAKSAAPALTSLLELTVDAHRAVISETLGRIGAVAPRR